MEIITENFFRKPLPGQTVKVYINDELADFGIVDSTEYIFLKRRIKRKKIFRNVKIHREIVILTKGKYKITEDCDFCLPEEKTRFI